MTKITNPQAITVHKGVYERVSINIIYKFKEFNDINKSLKSDSIFHPDVMCFIDLEGLFTLWLLCSLRWWTWGEISSMHCEEFSMSVASISSFDQLIIPAWDLMTNRA